MAFPAFWQQAWDDAQPRLEAIRSSMDSLIAMPSRPLRVGQVDAENLDQELLQLLKDPLIKSLSLIKSGLESSVEPEISLILQLLLYKYSVWTLGMTYGAKLQGLRYTTSRRSLKGVRSAPSGLPVRLLLIHGAFTVILPYINKRVRGYALSNSWPDTPSYDRRRRAWEALLKVESVHSAAGLLNFLLFLWNGRYRSLSDRALGLKLSPSSAVLNRSVSYEFMNRQMVWHAFTEFLLFLLPIINTRALRRRLTHSITNFSWKNVIPRQFRGQAPSEQDQEFRPAQRLGRYHRLPENDCAICAEDASLDLSLLVDTKSSRPFSPSRSDHLEDISMESKSIPRYPINTPYRTSCGHVYCYVCIADRLLRAADEGERFWECLRCEERVYQATRWEPVRIGRGYRRTARSGGRADNIGRFETIPAGRLGSVGSSSGLGHGMSEFDLDSSELSAMDLDSVSSIGLRTFAGSDDLSDE
ncbi:peroxisome assembly protein (Peroxin-2) [Serendipita sp. 400]|nr:peroxisome assembly protein (Peroxin-2) [Serendipita sp. 400]